MPPRNAFTDDGWFRSGDQVTQDAAGYIQVVDRIKDVINTGGVLVARARSRMRSTSSTRWPRSPSSACRTSGGSRR
nr:AMP-binding protein [Micrococcus luteus]